MSLALVGGSMVEEQKDEPQPETDAAPAEGTGASAEDAAAGDQEKDAGSE